MEGKKEREARRFFSCFKERKEEIRKGKDKKKRCGEKAKRDAVKRPREMR
jgi:hypothetical protein